MGGLFAGKVALVTGGATGIGRAAALRYAAEGARVVVADIAEAEAVQTVAEISATGVSALFIPTDVSRVADCKAMVEQTMDAFGRLDAAFNNAGTPGGFTNVVDCTEEEWNRTLAINLTSVWACMKYEIPAMIAGGGGAIVNTASEAAQHPSPHMVSYVTTKAGVVGLTRSAAYDFAAQNVRVNVLLPGPTVTPMLLRGTEGLGLSLGEFGQGVPMKRVGDVREQADTVIFLSSQQSSFITGLAVTVDGGRHLGT